MKSFWPLVLTMFFLVCCGSDDPASKDPAADDPSSEDVDYSDGEYLRWTRGVKNPSYLEE